MSRKENNSLKAVLRNVLSNLWYSPKFGISPNASLQREFFRWYEEILVSNIKFYRLEFCGLYFELDTLDKWDMFNAFLMDTRNTKGWFWDNVISPELKNKKVFIDIGANNGIYSILSKKKYVEKVYSFELNPVSVRKFQQNLRINVNKIKTDDIRLFSFGLSDFEGNITLKVPSAGTGHSTTENVLIGDYKEYVSKVKRIDDISLEKADVIKIDAEGAELKIIRGGSKYLSHLNLGSKIFITWT